MEQIPLLDALGLAEIEWETGGERLIVDAAVRATFADKMLGGEAG